MTYQELVKKVQTALVKADASAITDHIAVQVNVTGEAEGAFYIEIKDGVLYVEPFDYHDRDVLLTADGAEILAVAQGKISLVTAIADSRVFHEGNYEKTIALSEMIPVKKTARKPRTAKTEEKPATRTTRTTTRRTRKPQPEEAKPEETKPEIISEAETEKETETAPVVIEELPVAEPVTEPARPRRTRKPRTETTMPEQETFTEEIPFADAETEAKTETKTKSVSKRGKKSTTKSKADSAKKKTGRKTKK